MCLMFANIPRSLPGKLTVLNVIEKNNNKVDPLNWRHGLDISSKTEVQKTKWKNKPWAGVTTWCLN